VADTTDNQSRSNFDKRSYFGTSDTYLKIYGEETWVSCL